MKPAFCRLWSSWIMTQCSLGDGYHHLVRSWVSASKTAECHNSKDHSRNTHHLCFLCRKCEYSWVRWCYNVHHCCSSTFRWVCIIGGMARKFLDGVSVSDNIIGVLFHAAPFKQVLLWLDTVIPVIAWLLEAFGNLLYLEVCQCALLLFLNSANIMKYPSFSASLSFRKGKKKLSARSGELECCTTAILLLAISFCTDIAEWAVAFFGWRNQYPLHHFSCHFHRPSSCRCCGTSAQTFWFAVCSCEANSLWRIVNMHSTVLLIPHISSTNVGILLWCWPPDILWVYFQTVWPPLVLPLQVNLISNTSVALTFICRYICTSILFSFDLFYVNVIFPSVLSNSATYLILNILVMCKADAQMTYFCYFSSVKCLFTFVLADLSCINSL